ncbi:S-layer homology domain-containing protein [Paenibacillus doosanensis]|uniref:S-layer homology domain-containing protein n=1 Tax=Paenibacillus doosanensis TaxID=1229154 RepID=UPI00217FD8E9|nr:S-layer homology domain-containing protein [Paenibacillus doosanensis]MCS7461203.1 S-layer homology domain-containing protein [Paenibacillus doosanensis]
MNAKRLNRLLMMALIVSFFVGTGWFPQAAQAEETAYSFSSPYGATVDEDGVLYVTDIGKHAVFMLDSSGNLIRTLGTPGTFGDTNSYLNYPMGVAVRKDTEGQKQIYVLDSGNKRIQIFDGAGSYLKTWTFPGNDGGLEDIKFGNEKIYVLSQNYSIYIFNLTSGTAEVRYIGSLINGSKYRSTGMDIGSDGNLYVTVARFYSVDNYKIDILNSNADREIGTLDIEGGGPSRMTIDDTGNLYVTDRSDYTVKIYSSDGTLLRMLGTPGTSGTADNAFRFPVATAVDQGGKIYVTDSSGQKVKVFAADGTYITSYPPVIRPQTPAVLNVTSLPGTATGTTTVTVTSPLGTGNHWAVKVSSASIVTPNVGDAAPTGTGVTNPFTSGSDISGVDATTNKYVGVYELDSNNKIVSFKLITLTENEIKQAPVAAPVLDTVAGPGSAVGTTKVTINSPTGGNTYMIRVSNSSISTPNVGDAAPTGTGVTNPFTSGSDISGVDATINKYVGVYELGSNNKIVSFKLITLTENEIKQAPVAAPVLDTVAGPGSAVGTTKVTINSPTGGNTYMIRVSNSSISTPNVGDAAPTGTGVTNPFTSGSDISGVDATINKYVGVYELDSNNKIVSFKLITLTENEIKQADTPVAAPVLDTVAGPGSAVGTTKVTVGSPTDGNTYMIRVSNNSIATPNVGDAAPTGTGVTNPFTSGSDISGVDATTNKYVGVYELDSNQKIVSFKQITLTENEIKQADSPVTAPVLDVVAGPGSAVGTTKVTVNTPTDGNTYMIRVSSSSIATPNVGDAAPTGTGVTNPFTSGSDISGVDATTNKYVGVYELDSDQKIVSFKQITLTENEIKQAPVAVPVLDTVAGPGSAVGTTKLTINSPTGGNTYMIRVSSSSIATPNVGDAAPTGTGVTNPFTSGSDISGVDATTNKYVGVYELDSDNKIVSFKQITLTGNEIKQADTPVTAPVLDTVAGPGSTFGTTKVTVSSPTDGNTYMIYVSSSPISTPNVGDAAPTGTGVTNPFTSGADISGVDATTNKYVGVYELDSDNKIVSFKQITLTENEITKKVVRSSRGTTSSSVSSVPVDLHINDVDNNSLIQLNSKLGSSIKLEGELLTADGKTISGSSITFDQDGKITMTPVAPGEYKAVLNTVAPDGQKLVGNTVTITVDANGNASMKSDLIDPFGIASDSMTGKPIDGMRTVLYWADTELNRSKGRTPGTVVDLPLLPDMLPNQNNNPQITKDGGQYGWMVYADGDYYFTAEKDGYVTYDSRNDKRNELHGDTSYVRDGIIHVGQSIVRVDFGADTAVVETRLHTPYLEGYPDKQFKPELSITRAEIAAIITRILPQGEVSADIIPYSDVTDKHWANKEIAYVRQLGIMNGTSGNRFNPDEALTRAEFAQILTKLNPPLTAKGIVYTDTGQHWAEDAIDRVTRSGLMQGYEDGTFKPDASVTRAEAVTTINRYLGRKPQNADTSKWPDVPQDYWAASDIAEATLSHHYSPLSNGWERWEPEQGNAN